MAESKVCGARIYEVKMVRHGPRWLILAPDAARAEQLALVLEHRDHSKDDEAAPEDGNTAADSVDCIGTLDAADKAYL
jgi:hypothetical protein